MTMISIADTRNSLLHGGFKACHTEIEAGSGEIEILFRQRTGASSLCPVKTYRYLVTVERSSMSKEMFWIDNNLNYAIDYGDFDHDKRYKSAHYRKVSPHGGDGLMRVNTRLFNKWEGMCESLYINGRFMSQKFIYQNAVVAYDIKASSKDITVLHPNGSVVMIFRTTEKLTKPGEYGAPVPHYFEKHRNCYIEERTGNNELLRRGNLVDGKKSGLWHEVKSYHRENPSTRRSRNSHLKEAGHYDNDQRTGVWTIGDTEYIYHRGTAIPKYLWEKPKEELDLKEVLKIDNTQVRSMLLEKAEATPEKIASLGELIHQATQMMARKKKKKMRLYSVTVPNDDPMKFLQVECPSTDTKYFLRVPPTATKCHEALQWTYGRGRIFHKQLKFVEET